MATSADARRLRSVALLCAAVIAVLSVLGFSRGIHSGVWLALGALVACLALFATVWRLSTVAQDWRRELRAARHELHRISGELDLVQANLSAVTEGVALALLACDTDGNILFANDAARDMFQFPQPVGRTVLAVSLSYELHTFVTQALAKGGIEVETDINLSYPESRTVQVRAWNASGKSLFISIQDITELRRLEKVRSDFVANVSHELRTPMATIRAMAETMVDDTKLAKETKQRYLNKIVQEVDRLTNISDDLLTLSSAESQPVEKIEVDMAEVVRYATQQVESQARERGLKFLVDTPQSLMIYGDRHQLIQVVLNLVTNAIRYTPDGGVDVSLRETPNEAILEVRDTGLGIASEHLPRIFERFYRADHARSRETGGTGLGLSIVRHIVESLGGKIEVESELNVGSVFRVKLPILKEAA